MTIHYTDMPYTTCMETGVLVGNNFSPKQLKAIELFAEGTHNCLEVSAELKVSNSTVSKWRRNHQFMDAIYDRAKEILREAIPSIYKITKEKAIAGNYQHIKIILEHIDNIDSQRKECNTITFTWET